MKAIPAILLLQACLLHAALAQSSEPLTPVAWLAGCWSAENGEAGTGEHWLPPAGGTMLGMSRTVKAGRTVGYEFMQFRLNAQGQLVFIAQPSGQAETAFTFVSGIEGEARFENLQNDFPQRVIYRSVAPDRLLARIEGNGPDGLQGIDFPVQRTACVD